MSFPNTTADPKFKNETINDIISGSFDFKNNPGLVFLTVACGITGIWILFLTFYNSRLFAFIISKLLRKFYFKDGYLEIGSLSFSILSGKFMFRDVKYFTKDFSIQVVDGIAIIRWWFLYRPPAQNYYKEVLRDTEKLENGQCRLWVQLNGLECHLYNRSDLYNKIQNILKCERYGDARKSTQSLDILEGNKADLEPNKDGGINIWRELFPAIDFNIRSGKLAIGNQLVERTFWIHFNKGKVTYSMPDAPCTLDYFTHFFHGKCDDVRMLLSKSPGFKGKISDPPRWRGQEYTVLQSSEVKVTYYMDVPGFVPVESDISPESDPMWGLDIMFTKRVEINYGPWVDIQRDALQKYFLPNNFQEMPVTKPLEPEQQRLHTGFDVNVNFAEGASAELLFTKDEETVAIHIVCGNRSKGKEKPEPSSIHFYQPWIVNEFGYTTNIVARLHEVEATTSLQLQKFLESDTVEIDLNMTLPRIWNQFQHWTCELRLSKTTCYFLWEHVDYVSDLLNEWSVHTPADISTFVPYEWEFNFYLKDFELILLVNQFNWVDCTREDENNEIALCGETLDINFLLPFTYFQPKKAEMKFFFRGETIMLRTFIPESNTLRRSIISLMKNSDQNMYPKSNLNSQTNDTGGVSDAEQVDSADTFDEVDNGVNLEDQLSKGWRDRTKGSGWIDLWSVPVMILNLYYKYHPLPVENEMIDRINRQCGMENNASEPLQLPPDTFTIELEAGPSAIRLLGFFWRQFFLGFKENYFGLFQDLNEFNANREIILRKTSTTIDNTFDISNDSGADADVDMRKYRPVEVNLTVVLLNLQAELTMHSTDKASSPHAYADRLTFEMHKTYQETRLQLVISPITVMMQDNINRSSDNFHLSKGFLTLTGLQFRGDAMFSDKEVRLGNDTIEYAWLIEVQCGELKGKFTPLHIQSLIAFAETFVLHITDKENEFLNPDPLVKCHHAVHQEECKKTLQNDSNSSDNILCPTEDSVKYKMVRVSFESVNLFVAENECVCNIQVSPVRIASCNSRNQGIIEGGSLFINECCIRQYIQQVNLDLVESVKPSYTPSHSNNWVEVGVIGLGPITVDFQSSNCSPLAQKQQLEFLLLHDRRTKRLWFIWDVEELEGKIATDRSKQKICGCVGGCSFFGNNNNGVRFFTSQTLDASNDKYNHYGSESLWGGLHTDLGGNIKEHLKRKSRSGFLSTSTSIMNSSGKISGRRGASISSKVFSSNADTIDFGRSMSFGYQSRRQSSHGGNKETDSKLGFGRSRSLLDADSVKLHELRTADSESTFYSCNSEADITQTPRVRNRSMNRDRNRESQANATSQTSRMSLKSNASTDSYVSAISSSKLVNEDEVDADHMINNKPLVDPSLLSAYTNYMHSVTCMNWRQNVGGSRNRFSLLKNLKVISLPGYRCVQPSIPHFNPNLYGKSPFFVTAASHSLSTEQEEHDSFGGNAENVKDQKKEDVDIKNVFTIKFHRQILIVVTPLVLKVIERFTDSLIPYSKCFHLCHLLDSLHGKCISLSKQKYKEQAVTAILSKQLEAPFIVDELCETEASPERNAISVLLPEIKLLFFQVSGEQYIPSEHSSLSAKCGSEYSYDFDVKNTNTALLAALIKKANIKAFVNNADSALFRCSANIIHKHDETKGVLPKHVVENIRNQNVSKLSVVSGHLDSVKMQLLHLEGAANKERRLTAIPREKTKVDFTVYSSGNLFADSVSGGLDSAKSDDDLGEIIFEAGIEGISMSARFQSTLNLNGNGNIKGGIENAEGEKKTSTTRSPTRGSSMKTVSQHTIHHDETTANNSEVGVDSSQHSVHNDIEKDKEVDRKDSSLLPRTWKHNSYTPLGNSTSTISSDGSFAYKSSTRKGYVALDIDSGEVADQSDAEGEVGDDRYDSDENEHISILSGSDHHKTSSTGSRPTAVRYKKRSSKRQSSMKDMVPSIKNHVIVSNATGGIKITHVWINLAAPTHLQLCNNETEQDVNLVMVLVPALSCWISPAYEVLASVELLTSKVKQWKYSVLAAMMGQALPDNGKLLKKNVISAAVSNLAHFLQEECSSQLINVLRRQTVVSHRLANLHSALCSPYIPSQDVLEKGILALARQWKTVIVGAEGVENIFATSYQQLKKPVVGRGDLPPDAVEFLLKEARESDSKIHSLDADTVVSVKSTMNNGGTSTENLKHIHSEADVLLTSSSDESDNDQPVKTEQTLYDWMSKSPASTSETQSPVKKASYAIDLESNHGVLRDDKSIHLKMLRSEMPMVSVPTSGMQLADTVDVFSGVLASIGFADIDVDVRFLTQTLLHGNGFVESVDVTLHASNHHHNHVDQNDVQSPRRHRKKDRSGPSFTLDRLSVVVNATGKPSIVNEQKKVSTDVLFSVNLEDVHQQVDFALVRLILQVRETLEVIKEEDKFATKSKDDKTNRFEWNNRSPMSSPGNVRSKSWKNMYKVMTLYTMDSNMSSKPSMIPSPSSSRSKPQYIRAGKALLSIREETIAPLSNISDSMASVSLHKEPTATTPADVNDIDEQCKQENIQKSLSVTGTASLKKAQVIASISGLKLLFELKNLNGSFYRNKRTRLDLNAKKPDFKNSGAVSIHLDRLKINLIESVKVLRKNAQTSQTTLPTEDDVGRSVHGAAPELRISRTLLTCKIYRSHGLHTNLENVQPNEKGDHYSLLAIGPIAVDIPQHPGALRNTVTQFSKRLQKHFLEFDDYRMSREDKSEAPTYSASVDIASMKDSLASISRTASFRITSNSIVMSAALLPSLRVEYKIEQIHAWGNFSSKARFFCSLPYHVLSFNTKVHVVPLPTTTHIDLPPIKVEGYYLEIHNDGTSDYSPTIPHSTRDHHGFLGVSVNVGCLEQNLTTDLLNHMVFFQKGFVKEINEVVEVVETTEQVPLRRPKSGVGDMDSTDERNIVPVIYSIKVKLQGIQITATTPSSTGIRFKTGELSMEITNQNPSSSVLSLPHAPIKVYGQAKVDINIALGHFSKNFLSSNENEFTVYANFETSLGVSNILKEKQETLDKETILVSLIRPHLFVMPAAADKGVLVYLHYKNAYENWMEQRTILKSEFPAVAEHILNKIPQQPATELSSYLILQVNVEGLGVCLPLKESTVPTGSLITPGHQSFADSEPGPALLVTVAEASVMCCSSGAFVSTGQFTKFCLRLSDNFDHMVEAWSIDGGDFMNTYTIPEGSYELCSKTIMPLDEFQPGKWVMSLFWKMRDGVDIHIDTDIGKRLNMLINALTALTGESDVADMSSVAEDFETLEREEDEEEATPKHDERDYKVVKDVVDGGSKGGGVSKLPMKKSTSFNEENSLEKQLVIQTKKVNQLRRNDAHSDVISREVKQLQDIENALSKEFFKDVKKRLRRRTRRSTMDPTVRRKPSSAFGRQPSQFYLGPTDRIRAASAASASRKPIRTELEDSVELDDADAVDGPFGMVDNNMTEIDGAVFAKQCKNSPITPRSPGQVKFAGIPHDDAYSEISSMSKTTTGLGAAALEFEFNMVVDIKSGKCTLHSQTSTENIKDELSKTVNINRKQSEEIQRPIPHRPLRPSRSTTGNFTSILPGHAPQNDYTVLLIPGVQVRLYYLSKFLPSDLTSPKNNGDGKDTSSTTTKTFLNKSATLNASIGIQSLSKEMIATPSILDFLEKAFEPMITNAAHESLSQSVDNESVIGTGSMLSSSGSVLYSVPVDVVVLIRVQPSDIRFNCSPISKVECLLRIPSLDFAITSTPPASSGLRKRTNSKQRSSTITSNQSTSSNTDVSDATFRMGFTVCLSRFSFSVFHPYGKSIDPHNTGMFSETRRNSRNSRNQPISGRKDSLSMNVEFIKFNLSRKIVKSFDDQKTSVSISALCDIGSAAFSYDMRRLTEILDVPKAWYKRSLMQRLFLGREGAYATQTSMNQSNKTPTPVSKPTTEQCPTNEPPIQNVPNVNCPTTPTLDPKRTPAMTHRRGKSSGTSFLSNLITSPFPTTMSTSRNDTMHSYDVKSKERSRSVDNSSSSLSDDGFDLTDGPTTSNCNSVSEFETKVVIAFNVTRVDVSTNLGNIMGQAIWSTNDLRTNASVLLNNIGVSTASIDVAVRQGSIDAHGGVVGGYVELHDITADGKFIENFGETPLHSATMAMRNGEVRLDYMGSSILMTSLSSFYCKFEDHWLIPEHFTEQKDSGSAFSSSHSSLGTSQSQLENPEFKSCEIYLNCDARWDELQIIISRSTATDFVKMMIKLQDFFDQQHRSGVRAFNTLYHSHPHNRGGEATMHSVPLAGTEEEDGNASAEDTPVLKYQHWVELMNALYGLQLNNFPARIPDKNVVLGGRLSLCGNFASLACFHGTNFRTQNWGLFTVREPALQFTSETRVVEKSCQIMRAACVHDVTFSLGKSERHTIAERRKSTVNMYDFMATVRRVSRGRRNPPALGAAVQEWLVFVNTTSGDDMPFKSTSDEATEKFSHTKGSGGSRKVSFAPKLRYENESEVVFALPHMRIQLTTEHDQPMTTNVSKTFLRHVKDKHHVGFSLVPSPHLVDMSFLSTFEDSIHVTMDVSLLFYLHDLILSYMKEQESSIAVSTSRLNRLSQTSEIDSTAETSAASATKSAESAVKKEERYREFRVKNWKLDPRISLLSWAGKRMDPVSIDWVLERLGFTHAKMTIPKWIQRGALDPMDYTLAVVMGHLLVNMKVHDEVG